MKDFRDLKVWTKAHELALDCYNVTTSFPKHEIFGIVSQIRRAGSSIGANIAEGCGRSGNGEFQRFLQMAMGSASELENHLYWLETYNFWTRRNTALSKTKLSKSRKCSRRSSEKSISTDIPEKPF
jgi:four helix bundle protein